MARPLARQIADRISDICDTVPELGQLTTAINAGILLHTDDWEVEISEETQTALLKTITGCIVTLNVNLACYPTGETTAILFDENGDPV